MSPLLQQVLNEIAQLTPEERSQLIAHVQHMQNSVETSTPPDKSSQTDVIASDPLIGLFSGSPDLATQSEEILHRDLTSQGWTWKQPSQ
jgi:hypothetical protein